MSTAQATLEAMISAQHTHAEQECAELRHALPLDWQVVPDGSGSGFRVEVEIPDPGNRHLIASGYYGCGGWVLGAFALLSEDGDAVSETGRPRSTIRDALRSLRHDVAMLDERGMGAVECLRCVVDVLESALSGAD